MSGFLGSRLALAAAWIVVLAVLGGIVTLALLQPPPPATGRPLTVVVLLPEAPAAEPAEPAEPGEPAAEPKPAPQAETPPEAEPPAAEDQPGTPPEPPPTGEEPAASVSLPEAAPGAAPEAEPPAAEPPAEAAPEAPPGPGEGEGEAAPAEDGGEAPAGPAAEQTAETPAAEQTAETEEPQIAIPTIPPPIEQLPTWQIYRQPFNMDDKRPRIAVVLTGLGLSDSATEAAIDQLPPAVTLSFSPYARGLERWIALARARGHEVMLDLPMEPVTFPNEDPGPQGLLTGLSAEENLDRLAWVLSRGSAYVGLAGRLGSRFTASRESLEPVLREVNERGLMFLDRRTTENSVAPALAEEIGLPVAINNRSVDERQASRVAIDARLAQIERIALTDGFAVAMAQPYPVTLDRLAEWSTEITSRGFALAPISALADLQKAP